MLGRGLLNLHDGTCEVKYKPKLQGGALVIVVVTFGFETLSAKTSFINLKQLNKYATNKVNEKSKWLKTISKTLCMPLPAEVRLRCVRMGKPPPFGPLPLFLARPALFKIEAKAQLRQGREAATPD